MCRLTNVYEKTYTTLQAIGYPAREQGSFASTETLPETFVTYQVLDQRDRSHADGWPTSMTSSVQVALYSKRPALVQQADATLKAVMIPAGFLRSGGRNLPLDAQTRHYGYVSTYNFYDSEE